MVTQDKLSRQKSSMHISVDAGLKNRLHVVAGKMNIPVSHLTSLALSRAVRGFEVEVGIVSLLGVETHLEVPHVN